MYAITPSPLKNPKKAKFVEVTLCHTIGKTIAYNVCGRIMGITTPQITLAIALDRECFLMFAIVNDEY